jgi:hypothetical protein
MTRNLIATYITYNIINKMVSGNYMWENENGNEFNIDTGRYTKDGKKIYFRPYGTAVDYVRIPYEIAKAAKSGDLSVATRSLKNRLSSGLSFIIGTLTDTDWRGRPIGWSGKDKYGNEIPTKQRIGGIASEVTGLFTPAYVRSPIDFATGRIGGMEALAQSSELPLRFSGGTYSKAQQQMRDITGSEGKSLYEQNKQVRGQNILSENQEQGVRQGLMTAGDVYAAREQNNKISDAKTAIEESKSGSTSVNNKYIYWDEEESTVKTATGDNAIKAKMKQGELPDTYMKDKKVFYTDDEDGSIKTIKIKDMPERPQLTGNKNFDKELISTYKGELSSHINNVRKLYELGLLTREEAIQQVDTITAEYKTVGSSGGSGGSGGSGKKFISDAELVSAYTKLLEALSPQRTQSKRVAIMQQGNTPVRLKRQTVNRLY